MRTAPSAGAEASGIRVGSPALEHDPEKWMPADTIESDQGLGGRRALRTRSAGGDGRARHACRRFSHRQTITDAELGQQDIRLSRVGLDLAAQLAHEDAQIMRVVEMLVAPHFAQ